MKNLILTEKANKNTQNIDISSTLEIIKMINEEDKKVAYAVEKQNINIAKAVDLIVDNFLNGGRLLYFGAGTSGRLGILDASECPPTFGVEKNLVQGFIAGGDEAVQNAVENAEDSVNLALLDLQKAKIKRNDTVVAISASGNPKYLLYILEKAQKKDAKTILITSNPYASLKNFADICICVEVGEEAITGSSRLKSGTAQKMILNMLTTASFIKLGKTYKNFMIDLKATNEKLCERASRIVQEITKCEEITAIQFLEKTKYNVRLAIIMIVKNINLTDAKILLAENQGIIRKILKND